MTRGGIYCMRLNTRQGIHSQIFPFAWRSFRGLSPRELLKENGYIWPYIPSWVLLRTVYHFNSILTTRHFDNKTFCHPDIRSPRHCATAHKSRHFDTQTFCTKVSKCWDVKSGSSAKCPVPKWQTDWQTDRQTDRPTDRRTDGRTEGRTDGRTDS